MSRSRTASLALEQVLLRGVAVAGVSLVAMAAVLGTLVLVLMSSASFRGGLNDLALGILQFFVLIGVGVVTLVVVGALAARWWQLPHPVVVGVGGPLAAVALAPVLSAPMRLIDPGGGWDGLAIGWFDVPWFLTVVVSVVVGDAVVAWAASGSGVRLIGTALTLVALVVVAVLADGPLRGRTHAHAYATLGVPLLVPDVVEHPVTRVRPEVHDGVPLPDGARRDGVGVLEIWTDAVRVRIEPLPTADLSCAGLSDRSIRPGIPYSSRRDICEQLSGDRRLVRVPATSRPGELVALRPDALVSVALRDPSSGDPADNLALMRRMVESLMPTTAERLADLPQE